MWFATILVEGDNWRALQFRIVLGYETDSHVQFGVISENESKVKEFEMQRFFFSVLMPYFERTPGLSHFLFHRCLPKFDGKISYVTVR
jgi:hypothetical protein